MNEDEFRSKTVPAPFDYMAACDKTCSIVFRPDFVDKSELVNLLTSFASIAEALNLRKKLFFRGKTPDDVGLYHPPLHASLAVEFDANNPVGGEIDILHGAIGVITEAGEVAELLLRRLATGSFDAVNVLEESGDVRWYIVRMLRGIGTTDEICEHVNIEKLQGRHGEAFDVFRDANRDIDTERKRLERGKTAEAATMFERSNAIDAAGQEVPGPCLGDDIHNPPEAGALWQDGCWRRAFVRDVPGLAV